MLIGRKERSVYVTVKGAKDRRSKTVTIKGASAAQVMRMILNAVRNRRRTSPRPEIEQHETQSD